MTTRSNNNNKNIYNNLTSLVEPDEDDITDELQRCFQGGIHYVGFGDGIIAFNPQTHGNIPENLPQNGKNYCSKRPVANLPPHVYAMAHAVYKNVVTEATPQSIFISGVSGSGKSEVREMMVGQFLREAGLSRRNDTPNILMRGMFMMRRLLSFQSATGPVSSTSSMVVTLYFRKDGSLKTARIKSHLLNARHTTQYSHTHGHLNIFHDLVAALHVGAEGLSVLDSIPRILQLLAPSLTRMNRETLQHHSEQWADFVDNVKSLDIGENKSFGRHGLANSFLDCLLGVLLVASLQFTADPHTGQIRADDGDHVAMAAKMLGIPGHALYEVIATEVSKYASPPPANACECRDQLVHELYSRLIRWVEDQINNQLPDLQGECIPVYIVDLPTFDDSVEGTLESLCQNMVAEQFQAFLNQSVFQSEVNACREEGIKTSPVKKQKCDDVAQLAFTAPSGLLNQLEHLCPNPSLSDTALVAVLDGQFKKPKDQSLYIGAKHLAPATFGIVHSYKPVTYKVSSVFRHQNIIIPNREAQKLLAASGNVSVRDIFKPAVREFSDPNARNYFSYITYVQVQMKALMEQLNGTIPHHVRCIKPCPRNPGFDPDFVKPQIKAASLPDVIHQKKFGFSHWMTIGDFLRRYGMFGLLLSTTAPVTGESCKRVLEKAGVWGKGPMVTKKSVFLVYWHKQKLDAMVEDMVWKVTVVQARVRGYQVRKRLHHVIAARLRARHQSPLHRGRGPNYGRPLPSAPDYDDAIEEDELYQSIISKTLDRVEDLPSSAWAKVVYMEQGREVAKLYAAKLSLYVTGSYCAFDGMELGLSYFRNPNRLEETRYFLQHLNEGIELRRDSDGSLLVKRRCQMSVWVMRRPCDPFLSADVLRTRGELPAGHFVKIFDMKEFHSLIGLEMRKESFSKERLRKMCITALSFGVNDVSMLELPCWIALVNMQALHLLEDDEELRSISLLASQMALMKEEKEGETRDDLEEAKMRRQRKHWSKSDQRPHLKMKEANARKMREELRRRGEKVSDHMKYSWEEETGRSSGISMDQLYEQMRYQNIGGERSEHGMASPHKQWAKVEVALRVTTRELLKAESEENTTAGEHWNT